MAYLLFGLAGCGAHGGEDAGVAGAAAQVGGAPGADVVVGGTGILPQQRGGEHEEAGGAVAALQAVGVGERLLQRVELAVLGQPLDGLDVQVVGLDAEHEAGARRLALDEHGAGATDAVLAADVRAGEAEVVAQHVGERAPGLDHGLAADAVDGDRDEVRIAHACSRSRSASCRRSGVIGMRSISAPRWASASLTAVAMHAGAPIVPPSPMPLAPVSENCDGVSRWRISMSGISQEVGTR